MTIQKLIHDLAYEIYKATDKPKPSVAPLYSHAVFISQDLGQMNLTQLYGFMDSDYFYVSDEDWAKVLSYIYFDYDMPKYMAEKMDCEDFGILLKALVSSLFGLNAFGFVLGQMPLGFHGWDIFKTQNGWLQLEPQTGEIFPIGDKGYKPQYILL